MGRKKRLNRVFKSRQKFRPSSPVIESTPPTSGRSISGRSTRYQEFLDMAEMCDFNIPNQLNNWRRFFVDENSFLDAAETWLYAKMEGVQWPRIEDDVDKGKMQPRSAHAAQAQWEWNAYDGAEDDWQTGFSANDRRPSGYGNWWKWASPALPMTHKLPAPSGLSGVDMATVF